MFRSGQSDDRQIAKRKEPLKLKKSRFLGSADAVLSEMGSEQVRQMLHTSLAVHSYAQMDAQVAEYIITLFCDRAIAVPLQHDDQYIQLLIETNQK